MDVRQAVLLPGTGSDEVFVRSVFEEPLSQVGVHLQAPASRTAQEHNEAFDQAWQGHPIVIGGISLGAHIAARWAIRNPGKCAGLILALPAWTGLPGNAPAALAARASAHAVERDGITTALTGTTGWLHEELHRAWGRHGAALPDRLMEAAATKAPELAELRNLTVPTGIAACTDDPVHPLAVATAWAEALPHAVVRTTTLEALGEDRTTLGQAAVQAWLAAQP